jgi:hypothetical protein
VYMCLCHDAEKAERLGIVFNQENLLESRIHRLYEPTASLPLTSVNPFISQLMKTNSIYPQDPNSNLHPAFVLSCGVCLSSHGLESPSDDDDLCRRSAV